MRTLTPKEIICLKPQKYLLTDSVKFCFAYTVSVTFQIQRFVLTLLKYYILTMKNLETTKD